MPANKTDHLKAFNGIIDAINDLEPADLSGLILAINGLAGKSTSTGTTTGTGHAIVGQDTDLMCAIANCLCKIAANSDKQTQMWAFLTQDGPNITLDSPIFAYPDPLDADPPFTFTPKPITSTLPNTFSLPDGWLPPPGGLNGATDNATFMLYKCDSAEYIIRAIAKYYDSFFKLSFVTTALSSIALGPSVAAIYSALAGEFSVLSIGTFAVGVLVSVEALILIATSMASLLVVGAILGDEFSKMVALLEAYHDELICALYRARSISQARDNFIAVVNEHNDTTGEYYLGEYGNGNIQILKALLTDDLLSLLFACPADFDPSSITGIGAGMCDTCVYCKDTTGSVTVEKSSKSNYNPDTDAADYEPYPLTIELGTMDVSLICVDCETNWVNGSGQCQVWVDGVQVAFSGWGAQLTRQAVLVRPVEPETAFVGDIVIKMYHAGATVKGEVTIHEIAWVDTEAV